MTKSQILKVLNQGPITSITFKKEIQGSILPLSCIVTMDTPQILQLTSSTIHIDTNTNTKVTLENDPQKPYSLGFKGPIIKVPYQNIISIN